MWGVWDKMWADDEKHRKPHHGANNFRTSELQHLLTHQYKRKQPVPTIKLLSPIHIHSTNKLNCPFTNERDPHIIYKRIKSSSNAQNE